MALDGGFGHGGLVNGDGCRHDVLRRGRYGFGLHLLFVMMALEGLDGTLLLVRLASGAGAAVVMTVFLALNGRYRFSLNEDIFG